jgi:PAS domain S-box-containing protein
VKADGVFASDSWITPAPVLKQSSTLLAFILAILIVIFVPGLGIAHFEWFFAGIAVLVTATAFAVFITGRRSLWRFQGYAWGLNFIAIGLLRVGTDSSFSPLIFVTVLVVLQFAAMQGRKYIAYCAVGTFIALVVPVLVDDVPEAPAVLWAGIGAAVVLTNVAWIFHEVTNSLRLGLITQQELSDSAESLLRESVARNEELEISRYERSAAERMLRGVWLAVTEQAIIATSLEGRIVAWNPGAQKLLDYSSEQVENMRDITELLAPGQWEESEGIPIDPTLATTFAALLGSVGSEHATTAEWSMLRRDGSAVPVQISVTPRFEESGAQIGFLFVANDLSEAREVAKLKDEFVGLISHELRTPLSSIIGYLELLRDEDEEPLTDSQLHYLGVAERNAHRLLHLVGDLLFAAQVEAGSFRLDQSEVELVALLEGCVETAEPAADASGVSVVCEFSGATTVIGDPVRLGQAVDNLVSNAVKFTPRGGTVTLSLTTVGQSAVLSVRDTGMGIAAAEMDKLFSRFFRATTATTNAVPGVGLGLTITKAIVAAHHGEMGVESEEGVGTCFRISLPLAPVPVLNA